jgi:hypothetical protein
MYIIAPQFIREYLTEKFGTIGRLSSTGTEFIMESLFVKNDWKKHMSVNVDSGLWQCFKTGKKGNFISLYAQAENIGYFRAQRNLILRNFGNIQEEHIQEIDRTSQVPKLQEETLTPINIESCYSDDPAVVEAWNYLFARRLFNENKEEPAPFYLCREGKYKDRVIIPFKNDGYIYYFQGRALGDQTPKYLNPSREEGPKASDILYPYDEDADILVVCEGPLDARSLQLQGVNATATMGSNISHSQAEILSLFPGKIIMGYDNDDAGRFGISKFDTLRKEMRMEEFYVCPPPSKYKDWNQAHVKSESLNTWITENSRLYSYEYKIFSDLSLL